MEEVNSFEKMDINPQILRGIYAYGFETPSAIQKKAIIPFSTGQDIIAQAQSGTGKTATPEQAQDVHQFIRLRLARHNKKIADGIRILYGGSVKADNAHELFEMADIDGGLIGGASLVAKDFLSICHAVRK